MNTRQKVIVERSYDKCCFGVYRAVTSLAHKEYTIRDGGVHIKFRGKWCEVREDSDHEARNNYLQTTYADADLPPIVEIVWR